MPVCRVRQVVAAVRERRYHEDLALRVRLEWQTKTLASFISAIHPADPKKLMEAVEGISLQTDEEKAMVTPKEPQPGSYERMLQLAPGGVLGGRAGG